jgi:hypothetical protein
VCRLCAQRPLRGSPWAAARQGRGGASCPRQLPGSSRAAHPPPPACMPHGPLGPPPSRRVCRLHTYHYGAYAAEKGGSHPPKSSRMVPRGLVLALLAAAAATAAAQTPGERPRRRQGPGGGPPAAPQRRARARAPAAPRRPSGAAAEPVQPCGRPAERAARAAAASRSGAAAPPAAPPPPQRPGSLALTRPRVDARRGAAPGGAPPSLGVRHADRLLRQGHHRVRARELQRSAAQPGRPGARA